MRIKGKLDIDGFNIIVIFFVDSIYPQNAN